MNILYAHFFVSSLILQPQALSWLERDDVKRTGGTMKHRHYPWRLCILFLAGGLIACHLLSAYTPPATIPPDADLNFKLIAEAWNTIQRIYVDRKAIKPTSMTYGAIGGMVDSLGDTGHSRFLSPQMVKQERSLTRGEFEGIGAEVRMRNGQLVVVAPIDGSPAQRAGLKPGDIILKVDGNEVIGLPLNQAVDLILGPAGTSVKLSILDERSGRTKRRFPGPRPRHLPECLMASLAGHIRGPSADGNLQQGGYQ